MMQKFKIGILYTQHHKPQIRACDIRRAIYMTSSIVVVIPSSLKGKNHDSRS